MYQPNKPVTWGVGLSPAKFFAALTVLTAPCAFSQTPAVAVSQNAPEISIAAVASTVTITDYSNMQRSAIEADIRRAVAKSQAPAILDMQVPALAPGAGSMGGPIPLVGRSVAPMGQPQPAPEPRMSVTGIAHLRGQWRVEIVTDAAGAQFLVRGQLVPGTAWQVAAIDAGKVTLTKAATRKNGKPAVRVFHFAS